MDGKQARDAAIHLIDLQLRHNLFYPCELTFPRTLSVAHWHELADKALCEHMDEAGEPVGNGAERKPDVPFMLALATCAALTLSCIEYMSGITPAADVDERVRPSRAILDNLEWMGALYRSHPARWIDGDSNGDGLKTLLKEDYDTRDIEQLKFTLAALLAAMVETEMRHSGLVTRAIEVVDYQGLKPGLPYRGVRGVNPNRAYGIAA